MTTTRSPSRVCTSGITRSLPVLAPVVVSSTIGAPANAPVTTPSLARNSSITVRLKSFIVSSAMRGTVPQRRA